MSFKPEDRVFVLAAELFGLLPAPARLRTVCALIEGERTSTAASRMQRHAGCARP
jgi:hypothetical protein